jgi:hypothetical protein
MLKVASKFANSHLHAVKAQTLVLSRSFSLAIHCVTIVSWKYIISVQICLDFYNILAYLKTTKTPEFLCFLFFWSVKCLVVDLLTVSLLNRRNLKYQKSQTTLNWYPRSLVSDAK